MFQVKIRSKANKEKLALDQSAPTPTASASTDKIIPSSSNTLHDTLLRAKVRSETAGLNHEASPDDNKEETDSEDDLFVRWKRSLDAEDEEHFGDVDDNGFDKATHEMIEELRCFYGGSLTANSEAPRSSTDKRTDEEKEATRKHTEWLQNLP